MTRLLTLCTIFSTTVRPAVVGDLEILGLSPLTSFILALRVVLVDKLVISGILSIIFFTLALYIF